MKTSVRSVKRTNLRGKENSVKYRIDSAAPPETPYWFPDEQVSLFLVIKRRIYVASF